MKKPSMIAYVHTGIWPSKSPSTTFVTYNAIALAMQFDKVLLFVKRGQSRSPEKILKEYFHITKPANLTIIQTPILFKKFNLLYFLFVTMKLYQNRRELSAVVTRNVSFLPYLNFLKQALHIKTFYESHDFYADLNLSRDKKTKRNLRNSALENKYIPALSGLICLQNAQKALYQKCFPMLPIHVLRTGIHEIKCIDIQLRKYAAYIGSFDVHKGVEGFIAAAAKSDTQPDILLIGGKTDSEIADVLSLADKYSYKSKVTVTKWINKQEMAVYLSQVKVGIVSLQDTFFNRNITSPLKIFDYYSYCIPVIATDLPTTRELIDEGETGLFIPVNNIAIFAEYIDKMYQNHEMYAGMIKHVKVKSETLLWDKRALQLKEIVEDKA